MWTDENRGRYDRSSLRSPSDLTVAEWGFIEGLIAPGKRGGRWRTVDLREVVNGVMMFSARAASGGRCRRIYPHTARCTTTWACGSGMARWIASITRLRHLPRAGRTRGQSDRRHHR